MNVAPQLVSEERVHLAAVVAVDRVDRREHVPIDLVALQDVEPGDHPVEGRLAALVDAVGVVHLARTVDRDPDQEVVFLEELAPLVVEQRSVRLHRVEDVLAGIGVLLFELDRSAEEVQAHHRRLAALPGHDDLRGLRVGLQQLADVGLVELLGHPETAARVEHLFGQEEAVLAVEVADRPGWLRHQVKRRRGSRHRQHRPSAHDISAFVLLVSVSWYSASSRRSSSFFGNRKNTRAAPSRIGDDAGRVGPVGAVRGTTSWPPR